MALEARNQQAKAKIATMVGTTIASMIATESIRIVCVSGADRPLRVKDVHCPFPEWSDWQRFRRAWLVAQEELSDLAQSVATAREPRDLVVPVEVRNCRENHVAEAAEPSGSDAARADSDTIH